MARIELTASYIDGVPVDCEALEAFPKQPLRRQNRCLATKDQIKQAPAGLDYLEQTVHLTPIVVNSTRHHLGSDPVYRLSAGSIKWLNVLLGPG